MVMVEFVKTHLPEKYKLGSIYEVFAYFESLLATFSDEELHDLYYEEYCDINRLQTLGIYFSPQENDIVQTH
jgi:hypothetical protein